MCIHAAIKAEGSSHDYQHKGNGTKANIFLDMSGPFEETTLGNKYMIQVVDDFSQFGLVAFCKKWNEEIFVKFKGQGYKIEQKEGKIDSI